MAQAKKVFGVFKLESKYDWSRYLDYFDDKTLEVIFDRLGNYFLYKFHDYFGKLVADVFLRDKGFYYKCMEIMKIIANSRKFNIYQKPAKDNLISAPLKRYPGETWINHLRET